MAQAVKCKMFLYGSDSCLISQQEDPSQIEKQIKILKIFVPGSLITS